MKKVFIIILLLFTGCTTSKGVQIKPYIYPTINKTHLTNVFENAIIANEHFKDDHLLRAWFFKNKTEDDLEKLKASIGIKIGVRIQW